MSFRAGLIGTKVGNSSYFNEDGKMIPVTIIKINECIVSSIKSEEKNGYDSVQLISIDKSKNINKVNKSQRKLFTSLEVNPKKVIKEFRVDKNNNLEVGNSLKVNHFEKNQFVDVTGKSIGKGFAGAMKRHNFGGLRASHGVSISHRAHGSTGQNQDPGKVFKGKKMAGHMGSKMRTKQNIEIIKTDLENDIMYLKGSIPGSRNTEVLVKQSVKNIRKLTMLEKIEKMEKLKKVPEKKKK